MADIQHNSAAPGNGDSPTKDGASPHPYRKKAIEAASYVIFGFGLSQVIRLLGNILLTRLLVPELFGLITIARVFIMGLYLFSDVGLEPAIIQNKRAGDPVFLNTAWTIQLIRSAIIAALSCAIAFPVAAVYQEPVLALVIPAIGIFGITGGLQSTSLTCLSKELQQKKLTLMELAIQAVSMACMILAAYFLRNIWALLVGEIIGSLMRTIWSHSLNAGQPNRLMLEKESVDELLSFGKWILLSTAMMFLATQSDRILLGKIFSMSWFGVYSVAANLAELPKQVINRLSGKVLYPLISKYAHFPREELREQIKKTRGKMLLALALMLAVFGCFGDIAVRILFDRRYAAGTWILPILAFGMWPLLLVASIDISLLSIGKPQYGAFGNLAKFTYMVVFIPISYWAGGEPGAVLAVALNDIPSYIVVNYGLAKERLSLLKQDAWITAVLVAVSWLLLAIRLLAGMGLPGQAAFLHG